MAGGKSTMTGQHSLMKIVDLGQKRTETEKKKKKLRNNNKCLCFDGLHLCKNTKQNTFFCSPR